MKPIVIAGSGITGCVIAHGLAKKGYKVVLIEKDARIGGLAKTFRYGEFSFDIGPHRFFTQNRQVSDFIYSILKDDYTTMSRHSEVYFLGKYYTWPLRPTAMFNLPLKITIKSGRDLFLMGIKNKKRQTDSFEDYILMNYGPSLYNVFFKDYTEKFLGLPPRQVHSEWAKEGMKRTIIDESIASRNLFDILKLFLMFKPLQTEFIYPTEGIGLFCERLAEKVKEYEGEICTGSLIADIGCSSGKIDEVSFNGERVKPDRVVWTGSVGAICKLLGLPHNGLEYLSLLSYNITLNRPANRNFQWCYYGSKDIIFSRVTMPSLFSKDMAPEGKASLCVEVSCREGDQRWKTPEALVGRVKDDLIKVGLVDRYEDIGDVHIERICNAYPIYTLNYIQGLRGVEGNLSRFKNLILAGRTGLFLYNNMDNSIENGLEVVSDIIRGKR